MKDLIIPTEFYKAFPTIVEGLQRAYRIFESIRSFEDIERVFLKGAGLSANTYRSYLQAVKQLYEFTNGLHPLQVTPAHIEAFYDEIVKRSGRNTAYLRIQGLKRFFAGIRNVIPFYTSPFELMTERLQKKLSRTKKGNRTKKALTSSEVKGLLSWLKKDDSEYGQGNYAIVFMLVSSGLRAEELLQLHWGDIEFSEGRYTATFTGKGGREDEQELYVPAVEVCRTYFKKVFGRQPHPEDALFWTVPAYQGDVRRPLTYHSLWRRIKEIGIRAIHEGIIKRELQFSPHLFRRSYATVLYREGMKVKAIQGKTRHANIETLVKHYIYDDEPATPYLEKVFA
jgi:site-specific recombinase XerD